MRNTVVAAVIGVCLSIAGYARAEEMAAEAAPSTPVSTLSVEVKVGTGIETHNVVGAAETFPAETQRVYGWTRVTGATDVTGITHVWSLGGKEMSRVDLKVKGSPFRTWSYKTVAGMPGNWLLEVKDDQGVVLGSASFTVQSQDK